MTSIEKENKQPVTPITSKYEEIYSKLDSVPGASLFNIAAKKRLFKDDDDTTSDYSDFTSVSATSSIPTSSLISSCASPTPKVARSPTPHPQSHNFGLGATLTSGNDKAVITPTISANSNNIVLTIPSNIPTRMELLAEYLQKKREMKEQEKKTQKKPPFRTGIASTTTTPVSTPSSTPAQSRRSSVVSTSVGPSARVTPSVYSRRSTMTFQSPAPAPKKPTTTSAARPVPPPKSNPPKGPQQSQPEIIAPAPVAVVEDSNEERFDTSIANARKLFEVNKDSDAAFAQLQEMIESEEAEYSELVKTKAHYWTLRALIEESRCNIGESIRCFEMATTYHAKPIHVVEVALAGFMARVGYKQQAQAQAQAQVEPHSSTADLDLGLDDHDTNSDDYAQKVDVEEEDTLVAPASTLEENAEILREVVEVVANHPALFETPMENVRRSKKITIRDVLIDEVFQQIRTITQFMQMERPQDGSEAVNSPARVNVSQMINSPSMVRRFEEPTQEDLESVPVVNTPSRDPIRQNRRLRNSMFGLSSPFLRAQRPQRVAVPIPPEEAEALRQAEETKKAEERAAKLVADEEAAKQRKILRQQKEKEATVRHDPGSLVVLTPLRASKKERELLGTDVKLTPVRRSARTLEKQQVHKTVLEPAVPSKLASLLDAAKYAYAPNPFLLNSASNTSALTTAPSTPKASQKGAIGLLLREATEEEMEKEAKESESKRASTPDREKRSTKRTIRSRRKSSHH